MLQILTEKHKNILRALAEYQFLTYDQMLLLKLAKYKSNLATLIKPMRDSKRPLVLKIPHSFAETARYYLSKRGGKILLEIDKKMSIDELRIPKGIISKATQDATHREMTITTQILLSLSCEANKVNLSYCKRYFDKVGNPKQRSLKSETAVYFEEGKTLKSDMVFMLETPKKELYLMEIERGKNSQKTHEKCVQHLKAVLLGSANKVFNFKSGYRVLFVFELESLMKSTLKQLQSNPLFDNLTEYFLFKSWEDLSPNSFFENWVTLSGEERKMFY